MENKFVEVKKSKIPGAGLGLFAKVPFKKGNIIVEYMGVIEDKKSDNHDFLNKNQSAVSFNDGTFLNCFDNDLASFANDCIKFPPNSQKRFLMKTLKNKSEPFYAIHNKVKHNAFIYLLEKGSDKERMPLSNIKKNRAFLKALIDINRGEEICCHYGFPYWLMKECSERGFLREAEIEIKGFPSNITIYPAFKNYVRAFYPCYRFGVKCKTETEIIIAIEDKNNKGFIYGIPRLDNIFRKTKEEDD